MPIPFPPLDEQQPTGDDRPLSKTQQKKNMLRLQELGEALVELSAERLQKIDMPEELRVAIHEAKRLSNAREAKRRQMQYIGRLMREADGESLRRQLAWVRGESERAIAYVHRLETLRERLLDDETVLTEIKATFPSADSTHLRQLRRNAIKEKKLGKPPKSYRALFQALKALVPGDTGLENPDSMEEDHAK